MNKETLKVEISVDSKNATKEIKKVTDETEDLSKESKKASEAVDKAFSTIGKVAKVGLGAATAAIAAGAAALVGLAESTREYRTAQAKLTTAFKTAGSSAEVASEVYEELNSILGDSDVAVEAASHLAKLTTNEKDLQKWTNICAGVYATFGDSLPIEGLTEAANETAKVGTLTGGLADALNWAGVNEEEFQAQLDACTDEQERQALITETLNGLYSKAAEEYKKTNAEVIRANELTEKYNAKMAKMGGYVEPVINDVKELGLAFLDGLEEPVKDVTEYLTDKFIPGVEETGKWVEENKETILGAGVAIVAGLAAYKTASLAAKMAEEGLTVAIVAKTAAQKIANAVMNANPYVLATTAIVALTAGTIAYVTQVEAATDRTRILTEEELKLIEAIDDETESIKSNNEAYEKNATTITSQMEHTTELAGELLKLVDANGKVQEADEARVTFILGELNEALGTEYEMVGGVVQQYTDLKDEIYEVIAAKTANSLLEAKNEEYIQAINNEDSAMQQLITAEKDYEGQLAITTEARRVATEARAALSEKAANVTSEAAGRALMAEAQHVQSLEANAEKEERLLDDKKKKYDKASGNYADYYNDITTYEEASILIQQGKYNEAVEILKNKGGAYFDYADDVDEATKKALDSLYKEAVDTGIEAKRIKENFENGVKGYTKEMVEEAEKAHDDALKEWEEAYDEAHGIGGDMGDGLKDGLESKKLGLLQKAKSLISSIWNAMKKEADSHSPSKKTMALGKDMGKGLEIGIDDSTDTTEKAAENLVRKSIVPIEASVKNISWEGIDKAFTANLSPFENISLNNETLLKVLPKAEQQSKPTPIVLQVDGKTFAQISVDTINSLTKQTGNLPLVIA